MEWYRLRIAGIKDKIIKKLMEKFETYEDIYKVDRLMLTMLLNISNLEVEKIYNSKNIALEVELLKYKELNIGILSLKDELYPEALRNISQPPVFLYYKGNIDLLKENKKIAVVGTRKATIYGKNNCKNFIKKLTENKVIIVSGLAAGIDAVAHIECINNEGNTIAVVGSGIDVIYPKENEKIWDIIAKKGLIISEYPLGALPLAYNFPARNRIIVGLSKGVLVIESQQKGGSLITAELALEEGRDIFAIPGDIYSPSSEGTNNLIKNSQAKLVTSPIDILEEYGWNINNKKDEDVNIKLTPPEAIVFKCLEHEMTLDELLLKIDMKTSELLAVLMDLEIKKVITSICGGRYRRIK